MPAMIRYLNLWATSALRVSRQNVHLNGTSAHAPQRPRSRKLMDKRLSRPCPVRDLNPGPILPLSHRASNLPHNTVKNA
ncbi:hypothetical protein TNCV_3632801 [Trichonephila clavipes]|nr:hypothetical protein TNCV_3632801 [Trichonephila clavipes]